MPVYLTLHVNWVPLALPLEPGETCAQQTERLTRACGTFKQRVLSQVQRSDDPCHVVDLALVGLEREMNLNVVLVELDLKPELSLHDLSAFV
jgi:hypothetical protein